MIVTKRDRANPICVFLDNFPGIFYRTWQKVCIHSAVMPELLQDKCVLFLFPNGI